MVGSLLTRARDEMELCPLDPLKRCVTLRAPRRPLCFPTAVKLHRSFFMGWVLFLQAL